MLRLVGQALGEVTGDRVDGREVVRDGGGDREPVVLFDLAADACTTPGAMHWARVQDRAGRTALATVYASSSSDIAPDQAVVFQEPNGRLAGDRDYRIGERVLRPALVGVAKAGPRNGPGRNGRGDA